jgi:hypothetical protein
MDMRAAKISATMKLRKTDNFKRWRQAHRVKAEYSVHIPTGTYNFAFVNTNQSLLSIVRDSLVRLEFHPEVRHNAIRIRKRDEVFRLKDLLRFRQY